MISVSYSKAKTYQTCEKQWVFTYGMGLTPVDGEISDAVSIGQYGHKYLEFFYKKLKETGDYLEAREHMTREASQTISSQSTKAFVACLRYIDSRPKDGRPLFVEEKFKFEIPGEDGIQFSFVPDLVWEYTEGPWKGYISVDDFKFVQRTWPDVTVSFYRQVPLYIWGFQKLGHENVRKGVIWFINRETGDVKRKVVTPTKIELETFAEEHIKVARRIRDFEKLTLIEQNELATRTSNTDSCIKCFFNYPCFLELGGGDITKTLRVNYEEYRKKE